MHPLPFLLTHGEARYLQCLITLELFFFFFELIFNGCMVPHCMEIAQIILTSTLLVAVWVVFVFYYSK